jgi:hypothetical protein
MFRIDFDFIDHRLLIDAGNGTQRQLPLRPQPVADFYAAVMQALSDLGIAVTINTRPNEIAEAIRFEDDRIHAAYEPAHARRFWQILLQTDRVLKTFRSGFIGKCSPVHFFWGSFDLAVTRFSGRRAPLHPGGVPNLPDTVAREAYSHEVSSVGFWPGGGVIDYPAFYSYAYPEPEGFRTARNAGSPDRTLLDFAQSTYDAAADLGHWDRAQLECAPGKPQVPRAVSPPLGDT